MSEQDPQICPRAIEDGADKTPLGTFRYLNRPAADTSCHYCGSMDADLLMQRLEARDVELEPTDKSYKVYVANRGGLPFFQAHRTDNDRSGDQANWTWAVREIQQTKFYFQHLSTDQRKRFVELLNQRLLLIGPPGHFYRLPFFITNQPQAPIPPLT